MKNEKWKQWLRVGVERDGVGWGTVSLLILYTTLLCPCLCDAMIYFPFIRQATLLIFHEAIWEKKKRKEERKKENKNEKEKSRRKKEEKIEKKH